MDAGASAEDHAFVCILKREDVPSFYYFKGIGVEFAIRVLFADPEIKNLRRGAVFWKLDDADGGKHHVLRAGTGLK